MWIPRVLVMLTVCLLWPRGGQAQGWIPLNAHRFPPIDCPANFAAIPGLAVSDAQRVAVLRVHGSGDPNAVQWRAEILNGSQIITVDPNRPDPLLLDERTIELPIPAQSQVLIRCLTGPATVNLLGFVSGVRVQEAIFDRDWPKPMSNVRMASFRARTGVLGTLRGVKDKSLSYGDCNAVRVGRGYWLTNLHCFPTKSRYNELSAGGGKYINISIGPQGRDSVVRVQPVVRGEILLSPSEKLSSAISDGAYAEWVIEGTSSTTLDYVLLREIDKPFSDGPVAVMSLNTPTPGEQFVNLQWWRGSQGFETVQGDVGPLCRYPSPWTKQPDYYLEDCPPPLIPHHCSTQRSSSGAPLLDQSGQMLLALHFLGAPIQGQSTSGPTGRPGSANCAVAASAIISDLQKQGKTEEITALKPQ